MQLSGSPLQHSCFSFSSVSLYILNSIHTILLSYYTNKIQDLKKFNTIEYNIDAITNTIKNTIIIEKRELYAENYLKEEPPQIGKLIEEGALSPIIISHRMNLK